MIGCFLIAIASWYEGAKCLFIYMLVVYEQIETIPTFTLLLSSDDPHEAVQAHVCQYRLHGSQNSIVLSRIFCLTASEPKIRRQR